MAFNKGGDTMKRIGLTLLIYLFFTTISYAYQPQTGDLIFHNSRSRLSPAIALVTQSPYTHMGIVIVRQDKPYVFEALATVKYTPLEQWQARGSGGHYVIKRLRQLLNQRQQLRLVEAAKLYENKPYDIYFEWSDERIYCSELAWKMYDTTLGIQIGERQTIGDFDLSHPLVSKKLKQFYGDKAIPLHETVISPVAMFNSPLLFTVDQR
jgi:hypothetical protein